MSFADTSNEASPRGNSNKEQYESPISLYKVERVYNQQDQEQHTPTSDDDNTPEETTFRPSTIRATRYDHHHFGFEDKPSELNLLRDLPSFQLNHNEISIQVSGPVKGNKSLIYTIKGHDKEGPFETQRTQDQFIEIRTLLINRWPGCYLPALPPKRLLANTKPDFLEQRRKQFEMFCQNMSEISFLHYSAEYQIFLKSKSSDLSFELIRFQKIDYMEIVSRLEHQFPQALEKEATNTDFKKIEEFKVFLQSINGNFIRYKKVLKNVVKARHAYFEQFALLQETMCTDFEKKVLSGYQNSSAPSVSTIGSETLLSDMRDKVVKIRESGPAEPMEYLHAWIKLEGREIEAFLEAIGQREKYIALKGKLLDKQKNASRTLEKVIDGKNTMKTMFSLKGRDEEMQLFEKEIVDCKKEVELLNILIEKIALVLSNIEIDKFKRNKADQYHHVITLAAQNELLKLRDLSDFWITVLKKKDTRSFTNIDVA